MALAVKTGLDLFKNNFPKSLKGAMAGLLVHPASVNSKLEHAVNVISKSKKIKLVSLFGPQHGIYGQTQDNMIEWQGFKDEKAGLQVFSLYGQHRKPTQTMLQDIDVFIIDLQDIGSRYYTFIWTMDLCMEASLESNKSIVVLDRPNPIGGILIEGNVLDTKYSSFVGQRPLPVRHGLTIGEIACYLKNNFYPKLDLHIIKMRGWKRKMWFDETNLPWIMPSPNMPTLDTATVYPGMCLLESTNISEGRGTTKPFEIFGAPFINTAALLKHLKTYHLQGVAFRPLCFQPTFQKYAGEICAGCQMYIIDRNKFKPFKTGVAILKTIHDLYPDNFKWKEPPYEYETEKMPIDILAGTDRLRNDIERGESLNNMEEWWREELKKFQKPRKDYLLY